MPFLPPNQHCQSTEGKPEIEQEEIKLKLPRVGRVDTAAKQVAMVWACAAKRRH